MDTSTSSELADVVRAAVMALRAAAQPSSKVFVLAAVSVESPAVARFMAETGGARPARRQFVVQKIFAGKHKDLGTSCTVIIGCDVNDPSRRVKAFAASTWHTIEVQAESEPPAGLDLAFEGIFDLRRLTVPALQ